MSEFNGTDFYGVSHTKDPNLSTTTRNFEFRYARPDQLDRLIQKVQLPETEKPKKGVCKTKKLGRDGGPAFQSRDVDVETHISRTDMNKTRVLTAGEVDKLIGKAKSFAAFTENVNWDDNEASGAASEYNSFAYKDSGSNGDNGSTAGVGEQPVDIFPLEEVEKFDNIDAGGDDQTNVSQNWENDEIVEYQQPQPKWVEIVEQPNFDNCMNENEIENPFVCSNTDTNQMDMPQEMPLMYSMNMQEDSNGSMPYDNLTNEQPYDNLTKEQPYDNSTNEQPYDNLTNEQPYDNLTNEEPYYDSDLEYEMMRRADYTKYCGPRPKEDELANVSNDSEIEYPHFIELEPQIPCMDLSFLKNAAPLRYTDLTDETQEDFSQSNQKMKVLTKNAKNRSQTDEVIKPEKNTESKKALKKKVTKSPRRCTGDKKSISPGAKSSKYTESTSPVRTPRVVCKTPAQSPRKKNADSPRRKTKNIIMTKSLEDLKAGKIAIFSKMTLTQERTIEILDKLRLSLLDMYVPDNSFEKTRHQKNAFEFSVRFSRNFLYPLKGMMEDLKVTSVEQLNSASSNSATSRVANIYALILQSLQTYQKQLRFFLLDHVPQKLTALIEIIYATTNICLEKGIFDRNDAIIDCLQDRCTKFLNFLEDMHEERFLTARENYRKMTFEKDHSNYDLKMFMNDLNMYEPKLVPKSSSQRSRRSQGSHRKTATKTSNASPLHYSSESEVAKAGGDDTIATQVQSLNGSESSGIIKNETASSLHSNDSLVLSKKSKERSSQQNHQKTQQSSKPMKKEVIKALQTVTKDQVRQALEPIIKTLGTALDKKKNTKSTESSPDNSALKKHQAEKPKSGRNSILKNISGKKVSETKNAASRDTQSIGSLNTTKTSKVKKETKTQSSRETTNRHGAETEVDDECQSYSNSGISSASANNDSNNNSYTNNSSKFSHSNANVVSHVSSNKDDESAGNESENITNEILSDDSESVQSDNVNVSPFHVVVAKKQTQQQQQELQQQQQQQKQEQELQQQQQKLQQKPFQRRRQPLPRQRLTEEQRQILQAKRQQQQQQQDQQDQQSFLEESNKKSNSTTASTLSKKLLKSLSHKPQTPTTNSSSARQRRSASGVQETPHNIPISPSSCVSSNKSVAHRLTQPPQQLSSSARSNTAPPVQSNKKRRIPVLPPPPAPAGTPSSSARSIQNEHNSKEMLSADIRLRSSDGTAQNTSAGCPNIPTNGFCLSKLQQRSSNDKLSTKQITAEKGNVNNDVKGAIQKHLLSRNTRNSSRQPSVVVESQKKLEQQQLELQYKYEQQQLEQQYKYEQQRKQDSRAGELKDNSQRSSPIIQYQTSAEPPEIPFIQSIHSPQQHYHLQQRQSADTYGLNYSNNNGMETAETPSLKPEIDTFNMLRERDIYLSLCKNNRFYANPSYSSPWKVFTSISLELADEIVHSVENDFSEGVSKFVQDFIEIETTHTN